jgi:hypothetical protein
MRFQERGPGRSPTTLRRRFYSVFLQHTRYGGATDAVPEIAQSISNTCVPHEVQTLERHSRSFAIVVIEHAAKTLLWE